MKESILDLIVCLDHLMTIFIEVSIASPVQLAHMWQIKVNWPHELGRNWPAISVTFGLKYLGLVFQDLIVDMWQVYTDCFY